MICRECNTGAILIKSFVEGFAVAECVTCRAEHMAEVIYPREPRRFAWWQLAIIAMAPCGLFVVSGILLERWRRG